MKELSENIRASAKVLDLHVGKRLKQRREKLSLGQADLGDMIGISYQQVQKYERGDNKIPASRLYQISQVLRVSTDYFYEGVDFSNGDSNPKLKNHLCVERTKPLNILLVEDNPTDEMLTRNALSECNAETKIYAVHDGAQALDFLKNRSNTDVFFEPDIVLLDLNIPKVMGLDIVKEMKRDRNLQDIPVIVLTNSTNPEDMSRSYKSNVSGFVCKSFDVKEFNRKINLIVEYWASVAVLPSMQEA